MVMGTVKGLSESRALTPVDLNKQFKANLKDQTGWAKLNYLELANTAEDQT